MRLDHAVLAWLRSQPSSASDGCSLKEVQRRVRRGDFSIDGDVALEPKRQIVLGVEAVALAAGGAPLPLPARPFYLMQKPAGVLCQRHPREPTVYGLIPAEYQHPDLVCVGRLDRDTTGTLLFGSDGGLQSMLCAPSSRVWKHYTATLAAGVDALQPDADAAFQRGLKLEDGTLCAPATLERLSPSRVRVGVHEGFFHAVRRMLARVGGTVSALHRESFGSLDASDLAPGQMRELTPAEAAGLSAMLPVERVAATARERAVPRVHRPSAAEGATEEQRGAHATELDATAESSTTLAAPSALFA